MARGRSRGNARGGRQHWRRGVGALGSTRPFPGVAGRRVPRGTPRRRVRAGTGAATRWRREDGAPRLLGRPALRAVPGGHDRGVPGRQDAQLAQLVHPHGGRPRGGLGDPRVLRDQRHHQPDGAGGGAPAHRVDDVGRLPAPLPGRAEGRQQRSRDAAGAVDRGSRAARTAAILTASSPSACQSPRSRSARIQGSSAVVVAMPAMPYRWSDAGGAALWTAGRRPQEGTGVTGDDGASPARSAPRSPGGPGGSPGPAGTPAPGAAAAAPASPRPRR